LRCKFEEGPAPASPKKIHGSTFSHPEPHSGEIQTYDGNSGNLVCSKDQKLQTRVIEMEHNVGTSQQLKCVRGEGVRWQTSGAPAGASGVPPPPPAAASSGVRRRRAAAAAAAFRESTIAARFSASSSRSPLCSSQSREYLEGGGRRRPRGQSLRCAKGGRMEHQSPTNPWMGARFGVGLSTRFRATGKGHQVGKK